MIGLLLFLFLRFLLLNSAGLRCSQVLNNDAFFSLEDLTSTTDYSYPFISESRSFRIYYNFCRLTSRLCNSKSSYAVLFPLDSNGTELNDSCVRLTSDSLLSNYEYSLDNSDEPAAGLQLKLTGGDAFNDSLLNQFTFRILCDKSTSSSKFILQEVLWSDNDWMAVGRSDSGCPIVQISEVYQFILDYKYFFGILSIFLGVIECFFGLRVLKPSLFIIGYISGFGFLILIFGEFVMTPDSSVLLIWFLLLLSVFFGAFLGFLATTLPKIGFMALGLWLGVVLAFIINNLFLYKIEVDPPGLLLYFLMAVFGIVFAMLSWCIWRQICIVATSFLGAYLIIRSLSLYIGGYPNELMLDRQIKYKELANVGWEFYIYFLFLMLITTAGIIIQFRNKKKIGGKFAGEFDIPENEAPGGKYVELNLLEEAQNQKKVHSVIKEVPEEMEEINSKVTPRAQKINDSIENYKDEKPFLQERYSSKSANTMKMQEMEVLPPKKSFQGFVSRSSPEKDEKMTGFIELLEQKKAKNYPQLIELDRIADKDTSKEKKPGEPEDLL